MYTQMLAESIYSEFDESLPSVVYRGVHFPPQLLKLYEANLGKALKTICQLSIIQERRSIITASLLLHEIRLRQRDLEPL
jgi:hypothetical protein